MNTLSKQEEKELLIRLIEGDGSAFEKIYHAYAERVYYFAYRYLRSTEDSEEIVQEVFTKMWESRKNINVEMSFSGYLLTTTRNTIFNEHRKKVNHQAYCSYIIQYLQKNMHNVEEEIVLKDLMALVDRTVDKLPPNGRRYSGWAGCRVCRIRRFQKNCQSLKKPLKHTCAWHCAI